jgi:hypothetical protein
MVVIKLFQSFFILLIGALVFISSSFAFSAPPTLKTLLQALMIGLTLLGLFFTWRSRPIGAVLAVGGVLLAFGLLLLNS